MKAGDKVLINGAAGGLGTAAVQLAKHLGAEVTGVASTRNADLVGQQGADHFIDYTKVDFTKGPGRYDVIFDTVGKVPYSRARRALAPNGVYLSPVLSLGLLVRMLWTARFGGRKAKFSATGLLSHATLRAHLTAVRELAAEGVFTTVIDRRYELDAIAQAHRYVQGGHKRGNVVLEVPHADLAILNADRTTSLQATPAASPAA